MDWTLPSTAARGYQSSEGQPFGSILEILAPLTGEPGKALLPMYLVSKIPG